MLSTWQSLPHELWLNILSQLQTRDKRESRLVCRSWDLAAKNLLFTQVYVRSEKATEKLYELLTQKPAFAKSIRSINFLQFTYLNEGNLKNLLQLIIHAGIQHVNAYNRDIKSIILQAILKSPVEFANLKSIPSYSAHADYVKALYDVKNTVEHVEIDKTVLPKDVVLDLHQFKHLKKVKFAKFNLASLARMDKELQAMELVPTIRFEFSFRNNRMADTDESEIRKWLSKEVKMVCGLKELEMVYNPTGVLGSKGVISVLGSYANVLLDYLAYKYPKLQRLNISGLCETNFDRFFTAFTHVSYVDFPQIHYMNLGIPSKVISETKSADNIIHICYTTNMSPSIAIKKNSKTDISKFEIEIKPGWNRAAFLEILPNIGTTGLSELIVNALPNENFDTDRDIPPAAFFQDILRIIPQVQQLTFKDTVVKAIGLNTLKLDSLSKLAIYGARIDAGVLHAVSSVAPHLKHLELRSCLVLDQNNQFHKTTLINMPHTSLSTLTLSLADNVDDIKYDHAVGKQYRFIRYELGICGLAFIRIAYSSSIDQDQYILLARANRPMQISKVEFTTFSINRPIIDIKCKSLSVFDLDWRRFGYTLKFQNGQLESGRKSPLLDAKEYSPASIKKILESGLKSLKSFDTPDPYEKYYEEYDDHDEVTDED